LDAGLLLFVFVVGISASFALKYFGFPVWAPALASGGVIVAYAVIAYFFRGAHLEPDQVGDNAYYLGFVFTLASLAYTIWELGAQSNSPDLINQVIAGFGVALSSTIVGVIMRVILLQFRVDLVAREKETRLEINDAIRRFHVVVQDAIRGTRYLGTEIRQSIEEHNRDMAQSYERRTADMVNELSSGFTKILAEFLEQAKATNFQLAESARDATSSAEKAATDTLSAVTAEIKQAGKTLNDGMHESGDVLKNTLEETGAAVAEAMSRLCDEAKTSIETASNAHGENIRRQASLIDASTGKIQSSIDSFAERLDDSLEKIKLNLKEFSELSTSTLEQISRTRKESAENLSPPDTIISGEGGKGRSRFSILGRKRRKNG